MHYEAKDNQLGFPQRGVATAAQRRDFLCGPLPLVFRGKLGVQHEQTDIQDGWAKSAGSKWPLSLCIFARLKKESVCLVSLNPPLEVSRVSIVEKRSGILPVAVPVRSAAR